MKKLFEEMYDNKFCKGYEYDMPANELVDSLLKKGISISDIEMSKDADVGMKTFGGKFTVEQFYDLYDKVKKSIDLIVVSLADLDARLATRDEKLWLMYTKNVDLELPQILEIEKVNK